MIKKILLSICALFFALIAYLAFWPVPIDPQAWEAPVSEGYTGQFEQNMELAGLDQISIGDHHGPEDVAGRFENGRMIVYVSTQTGDIIRIDPDADTHAVVANTGGVALGVQFDANGNLIIADAHKGLLSMDANYNLTVLTGITDDGSPIAYADEMDIAADGKIYFSDASTKFGAKESDSTLSASLLEIMEHGNTGRVLVYDPADQSTTTIMDDLSFANGIAMCPDDACFLVAETGSYRVLKYWLTGPKAGSSDVVIDNLPGFPDNINRGQNGRYWIGLTSPRSKDLDELSEKPGIRKVAQRLPASMRPQAELYGFVFAMDVNGNVLAQYQDPDAAYPLTTGATEPGDGWLYIGSLEATYLGRKDISGTFP